LRSHILKNVRTGTIFGLIGALFGIIAPIAWDYFKTKSAIELNVMAITKIVDEVQGMDRLKVIYNGKTMPSMSKLSFVLNNSGRTPIIEKDVISYPIVKFSKNNEILEVKIDGLKPPNLQQEHSINTKNNSFEIKFPLLNPNDKIEFSVFVSGSNPQFEAIARIAGIENINVTSQLEEKKFILRNIPWPTYVIGFVGIFTAFIAFNFLIYYGERKELQKLWSSMAILFPAHGIPEEYIDTIKSKLSSAAIETEVKNVISALKLMPGGINLDDRQHKEIIEKLNNVIQKSKEAYFTAIAFGLMALIAIVFAIAIAFK